MMKVRVKETENTIIEAWTDNTGMKCIKIRFKNWEDVEKLDEEEMEKFLDKAWGKS